MSMRTVSPLIDVDLVSTTKNNELGALGEAFNDTYKQWFSYIYVQNGGSGTWTTGDVVGRMDGQTSYICDKLPTSSPSMRAAGVAQGPWRLPAGGTSTTVAAGSYVWILREGVGEVTADTGAITANYSLVPGNAVAGTADDRAAVTDDAFAFSTEAALATAQAACFINCRG